MGPGILFLWPCKSSSSQESPNLGADSICILRWSQPLGSSLHIGALQGGAVEAIGMMELGPQLWSRALALPQAPWSLWTHSTSL